MMREGLTLPAGDRPERFYHQADGPELLYHWYVFVERKNADGSGTPVSPKSEELTLRWE
jgi:hypothetical protein